MDRSLRRSTCLLLLLLAGSTPALAGRESSGSLGGTVVDSETHKPVPWVNVVVLKTDRGATTSAEGEFLIKGLAPGTYVIRFSQLGFSPQEEEATVVAGRRTDLEAVLTPRVSLPAFWTRCPEGAPEREGQDEGPVDETFGFKLGDDRGNVIDTFLGMVSKDLAAKADVSVPMVLTPGELAAVYRKVVDIGYFDYPEPCPALDPVWGLEPHCRVSLTIRRGGLEKTLTWSTDHFADRAAREEWERLGELVDLMECVVQERREFKKLPKPAGFYY